METFQELYAAIDNPEKVVYWKQSNYIAERDKFGRVNITCTGNDHMVGLYEPDYPPTDFYEV
jgi:hypothetical protein